MQTERLLRPIQAALSCAHCGHRAHGNDPILPVSFAVVALCGVRAAGSQVSDRDLRGYLAAVPLNVSRIVVCTLPARDLVGVLQEHPRHRGLNALCSITALAAADVAAMLDPVGAHGGLRFLRALDLRFTDGTAALVAHAAPTLRVLRVWNNGINGWGGGGDALLAALRRCGQLRKIDISVTAGPTFTVSLADALGGCTRLRALHLRGERVICEHGGHALLRAAARLPRLRALGLDGNTIGPQGGELLATALEACGELQDLFLEATALMSPGAAALAKALPRCPTLQRLDVRNCNIPAAGVVALADAAACHPALRELRLSGNTVGDRGAEALAGAIRRSPCPLEVDAKSAGIPDGCRGAALLRAAVEGRPGAVATWSDISAPGR
jgi:hypothetical protein